ncbi:hypothetical protein X275_01955 [Marinitoga sp. 1197]|uniref:GGDEF domain-containing protein n=1 Tax=Marinitoga sp. 1197 TaxID=1428449 RepID=UPI0006416CF5|nr:GGDEF domain-containing protein [Marinitoga sp. 1197]KLO23829.1 hypothetical protein X275_01955 [Marinitoga sp. 1197]
MKKIFIILVILSFTYLFGNILKVGVYENPPLMYAENGKIKGILPEIMDYIFKKENIDVKYVYLNFSEGLEYLENDLIDILLGVGYTKDRSEIFKYNTVPLYDTYGKIFTLKNTKIHNFFDLKNKTIGVLKNDIFYLGEKGLKKIDETFDLNIRFLEYNTYEDIFRALIKKEIDAGLVNYYVGMMLYKKYNAFETPISFYLINAYLIYHKDNLREIIHKIDSNLTNLKSNPNSVYYTITSKYLHNAKIPLWITLILTISLLILIVLALIIWVMNNIIKRKTAELRKQIQITKNQNLELEYLLKSLKEYTKELNITKEKLEKSEMLLKSIIENSQDGILYVDKNLNIILANSVFKKWAKRDFNKKIKENDNLKEIFKGEYQFFDEIEFSLKNEKNFIVEKAIKRLDGSIYWVSNNYYPIYRDSKVIGIALISRDITKLKENEFKLQKLAHYDSLTGIYNRNAGFHLLEELIFLSKREKKPVTIGFIDVDNLKIINDTYGHNEGDKALKVISETIKKHIRRSDILARYGGDEFFVGLYNCKLEDARRLEKNITEELKKLSKKSKINYSVSLGFIEYNHKETLDSIISKADKLMYKNKRKKNSNR